MHTYSTGACTKPLSGEFVLPTIEEMRATTITFIVINKKWATCFWLKTTGGPWLTWFLGLKNVRVNHNHANQGLLSKVNCVNHNHANQGLLSKVNRVIARTLLINQGSTVPLGHNYVTGMRLEVSIRVSEGSTWSYELELKSVFSEIRIRYATTISSHGREMHGRMVV